MKKVELFKVKLDNYSSDEALEGMRKQIKIRNPGYVTFVNTDVLVKAETDHRLRDILNQADFTLTDGKPLIWISRLLHTPIKEKVSGSDLVPRLCAMAEKNGWTIFILGGAEGVAQTAAENLKIKYRQLKVVGTYSPHYQFEKDEKELARIEEIVKKASPDILIVSLGCPKQELLVAEYYQKYGAVLSVCAGATVDFLAGNIRRCPKWVSNIGFEWFFRFLMEPRRLFKRYFIDDMKIFGMVIREWRKRRNR